MGLGEALDSNPGKLKIFQGRNEQGMCHSAIAYAKQNGRRKIIACASSVGPGAANMVTACATATVNNIPLLVFPADTFCFQTAGSGTAAVGGKFESCSINKRCFSSCM